MKKFIASLLLATFCLVATTFAQSTALATLSHEGTISTFYGTTALREAYNAAVHGDVITLSSGTFTSVNISKAITIRGAGMTALTESEQVYDPTVLSGNFTISITDSTSHHFTLEGIYTNNTITYGTLNFPTFLKCRIKEFSYYDSNSSLSSATFIHCRIISKITLYQNSYADLVNCVVASPYCSSSSTALNLTNCVLIDGTYNAIRELNYSTLKNCIIITSSTSYNLNSNNPLIQSCVSNTSNQFNNATNSSNKVVATSSLFKTYTGGVITSNDEETFELTDEAKTTYLGSDGTQVGIYGGSLPFDPTPSNPQITKFNVASKSTADGKLSVDIQVNTAE
jgi:hypothetical protein